MKLKLRDYQEELCFAVVDAIEWGYASVLATAATGTGKTVCFSSLIQAFLNEDMKVLVLAPRRELIQQAYLKIRDMCDLKEEYNEIDKEMGSLRFDSSAKVVVGCINTCYKETRLAGWIPDAIICDEAHFCLSPMWEALFCRFPQAVKVGLTATAMRGDRRPVFHENIDGSKTQIEVKGAGPRDSTPQECGFFRHVYDYPLEDAVADGYSVEPRGIKVRMKTDISKVKINKATDNSDADFSQKELTKFLEASDEVVVERINTMIAAWKEEASDRPTVVFCPSVKYAHKAAELWQEAGHTALAIDCDTDTAIRDVHHQEIKDGNCQVTCNYGIFSHGTDIPEWSAVVILRPTVSPGLLSQMIGRGTRPARRIARKLGELETAEERLALIAASEKPDCLIFDAVDVLGKHAVATLPTILGLPSSLDLQGHGLLETAKMMKEFESVKKQVLHDCPGSYEELEASLERVSILNSSGSKVRDRWLVAPGGTYSHGKVPPGYSASLEPKGDAWTLTVKHEGQVIYHKEACVTNRNLSKYFDGADGAVHRHIDQHQKMQPPKSTGMYLKLLNAQEAANRARKTDPRLFYLLKAKFTPEQIDRLHDKQVRAIVQKERDKYWEQKKQREAMRA